MRIIGFWRPDNLGSILLKCQKVLLFRKLPKSTAGLLLYTLLPAVQAIKGILQSLQIFLHNMGIQFSGLHICVAEQTGGSVFAPFPGSDKYVFIAKVNVLDAEPYTFHELDSGIINKLGHQQVGTLHHGKKPLNLPCSHIKRMTLFVIKTNIS